MYLTLFLLLAAAVFLPPKAWAAVDGAAFTLDNVIRDLTWNAAEGRIEFKTLVHDTWGDARNEYIGGADNGYGLQGSGGHGAQLYVDGLRLGYITEGCESSFSDSRANFYFYSSTSSNTGRLYTRTHGSSSSECNFPTSSYSWVAINYSPDYYYTVSPNQVSSDQSQGRNIYAEFAYYPNITIEGDNTLSVTIDVKDVNIQEESSWQEKSMGNFSKTVTATNILSPISLQSVQYTTTPSLSYTVARSGYGSTKDASSNVAMYLEYYSINESTFSNNTRLKQESITPSNSSSFNVTSPGSLTAAEVTEGRQLRIRYETISSTRAKFIRYSTVVKVLPIKLPVNPTVEDVGCGKLKVKWDVEQGEQSTQAVNTRVYSGSSLLGSPAYTSKEFEWTIPVADIGKGNKTYSFALTREPFTNASANVNKPVSIIKNMNYRQMSSFAITPTGGKSFRLTWNTDNGYYCSEYKYRVRVTQGTESFTSGTIDITKTEADVEVTNNNFNLCQQSTIYLEMLNGSTVVVSKAASNGYAFISTSSDSKITQLAVSKGFYPTRVQLDWTVSSSNQFVKYLVYRKEYGSTTQGKGTLVATIDHSGGVTTYSLEDMNAVPGTFYDYTVEGQMDCGSNNINTIATATNVGYILPFGTVSGRISYGSSQIVRGVTVMAQGDGSARNKAIDFSSSGLTHIQTPYQSDMLSKNAFTFQCWVQIRDDNGTSTIQSLMDAAGKYAVEVDDTTVYFSVYNGNDTASRCTEYEFTDARYVRGSYRHISIAYEAEDNTGTAILYIDGLPMDTVTNTGITVHEFPTASAADKLVYFGRYWESENYLNGYMDELRLWNRALSAEEVAQNYNAYISGKESGLKLYYRFDELDELGEVYDMSGAGTNFNMNHGTICGAVQRTSEVSTTPTPSQLSIKAVTDANGNYLINTIPYTGDGNTYNLVPSLGIHQFDPSSRPLFFSSSSVTHNNVDFTDISSFPVTGKITYASSNYPVDGVQIAIDGMVASKDGEIIVTDAEGNFTVDVPIGSHFITVSKQGHTFANGGRFPANTLDKYNFQTSMSGLEFSDLTTVTIIGRIAGGQPQTDLPLGFGLSKANIGKGTLTLRTVNDVYRLNLTDNDVTVSSSIGGRESKTTFKHQVAGSLIEVETNAETGEFLAVLPPVRFSVVGAKTADFYDTGVDGDPVDFSYSTTMFDINPAAEMGQTEYTNPETGVTSSISCHDSIKVTRYSEPVLEVWDAEARAGAFGDSVYVYSDPLTGQKDNIRLYTVGDNGEVSYALGVPVLTQKKAEYVWQVRAYEEYRNRDNGDTITDRVPLADKVVSIANALASERLEFDTETYAETGREETNTSLVLDTAGIGNYVFKVSFPNMAGNHRLAARLSINVNGKGVSWDTEAILFGQMPSDGNNFVTAGPDFVDFVLRDPPGSNSSAYIEKGSTYTRETTNTFVETETFTTELTFHFGVEATVGTGVGVMVMNKLENKLDLEANVEEEKEWTKNGAHRMTITFNEQTSTSSDPLNVGSMADVYIGHSTNYIYGLVNELKLYPSLDKPADIINPPAVGSYSLFNKTVNAIDMEFGTAFSYSQAHLVEHQIPQWKELRNQLITSVAVLPELGSIVWGDDKIKYLSTLPKSHPDFGKDSTYVVYVQPDSSAIDKVKEYNTNILNWELRIAENEEMKVQMFEARASYESGAATGASSAWNNARFFENVSYDAGVSLEKSLEVSYEDDTIRQTLTTAGAYGGARGGLVLNGISMAPEVHVLLGGKKQWGDSETTTEGNSMKFGYRLSEDAGSDALSVDVYGPSTQNMKSLVKNLSLHNMAGFTFRTRAGQTSCPYEPADSTLFYRENGKPVLLNYGTFRVEYPDLMINGQRDTASVDNIPSGREATFTLQLSNLSEAGMSVTYQLYPDNATNPDGLVLSLDGEPLTIARTITVPYGQTLTKTLKVRQSSLDILDYRGVGIRFGSVLFNFG
jgi:hypothetical protein